jgi:hypothetical protein
MDAEQETQQAQAADAAPASAESTAAPRAEPSERGEAGEPSEADTSMLQSVSPEALLNKSGPAVPDENADLKKAMADVREKIDNDPAVIAARLADKFQVVPDGYDGPRAPNTVTQSEMQKISELDSRIRQGQTDIKFDDKIKAGTPADPNFTVTMSPEEAKQFKAGAMQDMETMMQTQAGRELLNKLADNTHVDQDGNVIHHTTTLAKGASAGEAHCDPINDPGEVHASDGKGDDSRLVYTPGYTHHEYNKDGTFNLDERSDQTLVHEMNHAYHYVYGDKATGTVNPDVNPVHPDDAGVAADEHQAVGLDRPIGPPTAAEEARRVKFTENDYREQQRELGIDAPRRDRYNLTSKP